MACNEFENRILDYLEGQLPPSGRSLLETHLAGCADCRTFARQLQQLDATLSLRLKAPSLPADFTARLGQRIRSAATLLPENQRATRRRQLQREYETSLARLRRESLGFIRLSETLGYVVLAVIAAGLAWKFAPGVTDFLARGRVGGIDESLLLGAIGGAVFLFVGLFAALRYQPRIFWRMS